MQPTLLLTLVVALSLAMPLMNPAELRSKDGLLDVYLVAEQSRVMFDDNKMIPLMTWNGSYIPPTLRLLPGDGFRLTIENRLSETTNVHFHGLTVSPKLPADDSLHQLPPAAAMSGSSTTSGGSSLFTYTFRIPTDHAAGLYFYHSHSDNSEMQVFQGLSGLIVIEGVLDSFAMELQMIKEQFFALKDLQIQNGSIPSVIDLTASTIRTINGLVNPTISIRPNEVQFWRIANVGADLLYNIAFSNITAFEIARDGRLLNQPVVLMPDNGYFLGPGNRAEFLVIGPSVGMYMLRSLAILNGEHGPSYPEVDLATIVSEGSMVMSPPSIPSASEFPSIVDLRTSKLSTKRMIEYTMMNSSSSSGTMMMMMTMSNSGTGMQSTTTTMSSSSSSSSRTTTATTMTTTSMSTSMTNMNGMTMMGGYKKRQMMMTTASGGGSSDTWMINNRMYDPNRIDVSVSLGSTELWIIRNCDLEYHNFHIHQVGFQVISINNVTVEPFVGHQDTMTVPPADSMAGCSEVQVIIAFTNPIIVGKFLFHCHIMKHEDRGMMAIVQVTDNRSNNNSPPYSLSPVLLAVLLVVVLVLAIVLVVLAIYLYKSLQKKKANNSSESDYHLTI